MSPTIPTPQQPEPRPSLLRALLDACAPDGSLDETTGREIEREYLNGGNR